MPKPTILLVADYFAPAYKAGGPIRSLSNLVRRLADEFEFLVLTRNRDLGDPRPFPGIEPDRWLARDGHRACYLAPTRNLPGAIRRALRGVSFDLVYLNSFFSPFSISLLVLRRCGLVPRVPVVLTPRGELAPGALALKAPRKRAYLRAAAWLGLHEGVVWQATSDAERGDVARVAAGPIRIVANVPDAVPAGIGPAVERPPKRPGTARFVFLGRIARNKNVEYALRRLSRLRGELTFDVFGTSEDPAYLAELSRIAAALPPGVRCAFPGPVRPTEVHATLAAYHYFLYPSFHESFGHGILEAMLAGLPVMVSDGTFWRGLAERGAGFDVPLRDEATFEARLQQLVDLDGEAYERLSRSTASYARSHVLDSTAEADARELFRSALAGRRT
jgi:glycosyltransferase involved in cell wall biosynthesis